MRDEIEARPLVLVFIGLAIGLTAVALPVGLVVLFGFVWVVRPIRGRLLIAFAFILGLLSAPTPPRPVFEAVPVHGLATISSVPKLYADRQVFNAQLNGRTLEISTGPAGILSLGDRFEISGIEKPVPVFAEGYASVMGIEGRVSLDYVQVEERGPWVYRVASAWRQSFVAFFAGCMPEPLANMVDAVSFNAKTLLDAPTQKELKDSGLIHIVTASGLQVLALAVLVAGLLRFLPVPRHLQVGLLCLVLSMYAIGAGLNPAVVRATVMAIAGLAAYLVMREPDPLSALALTGVGYLVWSPVSIYNVGFQLSYITVAAVVLFFKRAPSRRGRTREEFIRVANDFLRLSGVILAAITPLSAYTFGVVSVVSVGSNLLDGWCTPLLVLLAFLTHGLSWVLPAVAQEIAGHFVDPLASWVTSAPEWAGRWGSTVTVPPFSGYWLVLFYGAWALTYRRRIVQP